MERFLMKSACWSVKMTRKVRLLVNLPLLAWRVSWPMDLVGGLS